MINEYCNDVIYIDKRIEELKKSLENRRLNPITRKNFEDELTKLENKKYPAFQTAIQNLQTKLKLEESVASNLIEYCKTKGEIQGQIYKWCLAIDKEAKKITHSQNSQTRINTRYFHVPLLAE